MSIRRGAAVVAAIATLLVGSVALAPEAWARWAIHNGANATDPVAPPGGTDTQTCPDRVRARAGISDLIVPPVTPETYEIPNSSFFAPVDYEVYAARGDRTLSGVQPVFNEDFTMHLGYEFADGTPVPRLLSFTTQALTELTPPEQIFDEVYAVTAAPIDRALPPGAVTAGDEIGLVPAGGESSFEILDVIACRASAPTIQTASPGNGRATVRWSAPASNGGAPITGYTITPYVGYYPLTPRTFSSTATTQTVTGLTNGTSYRFKVAAINAAGTGPQSAASNAVTPRAS